jgi:glycerol-3-phosphate acyltransferase PlsX
MALCVAIDCMGGDHGPSVTVPAALSFLATDADASVLLVGRESEIQATLAERSNKSAAAQFESRIDTLFTDEVVEMDDPPAIALRSKRKSSMHLALKAVRDGQADACVSGGNTGALMAISRFVLKMLPGIERPAIASQLPNRKGSTTTMLDLGANVDCEPEHLLQFGLMGAALVTALDGGDNPTVGLLNIGEEVIKGNDTVKQASTLLTQSGLNFYGNVEGNDIYTGTVDVIVTDGFVGNVALKTSEGLAQMLGDFIREEFSRNLVSKMLAAVAYPVLKRFKARVDHRRYNGGALVGLRGVVFKSHGSADALAYEAAIRRAGFAARNKLVESISDALTQVQQRGANNAAKEVVTSQ